MSKILISFLLAVISLSMVSCSQRQITYKNPSEETVVTFDNTGFISALRIYQYNRVVPTESASFLYGINGWIASDTNTEVARIYSITLPEKASLLHEITDYHIAQMSIMGDSYVLLLEEYERNKSQITSMVCFDENWEEEWIYHIQDSFAELIVSNEYAFLVTYYLTDEQARISLTILDKNGKEVTKTSLDEGERILYATHIIDSRLFFFLTLNLYDPAERWLLRATNEDYDIQFEIELPIRGSEETIISIEPYNGSYLLLTDKHVYSVEKQSVSMRTSFEDELNSILGKSDYMVQLSYGSSSNASYYFGLVEDRGVFKYIIGIFFSENFTECTLQAFTAPKGTNIAIVDEHESVIMISEGDDGELIVMKWNHGFQQTDK